MARYLVRVFSTALTWITEHVGRRGGVLLSFGYLDWMIADGLRTIPDQSRFVYSGAQLIAPLEVWARVWLCISGLMVIQAFMRRDAIAFGIGTGMQIIWAIGLMLSSQVYDVPRAGWLSSIFLTFAALQFLGAGRPRDEATSSFNADNQPPMVGVAAVHDRPLGVGYLGVLPGEAESDVREPQAEDDPGRGS